MAINLMDLERRASRRAEAFQRGNAIAQGRNPVLARSKNRAMLRRSASGRALAAANDGGLAAKLIANGIAPDEAARLAREITAVPTQMSHPGALGLRLPSLSELQGAAKSAALTALGAMPIVGAALNGMFALCDRFNLAIAIGLSGVGGVGVGGGAGGGIVIAAGRRIGFYGTLGAVLGEIADLHGGIALTIVNGGLSAFNGTSVTIGGAIGEGLGLSGNFILNTRAEPIGISIEVGLHGGVPIDAIGGIWETQSWTTTMSAVAGSGHICPGGEEVQGHAGAMASRGAAFGYGYSGAFNARETSFTSLAGVPVHYDRLQAPNNYGSKGVSRPMHCTQRLKDTLENCMAELFTLWGRGAPSIILTAGTIGDGANAHGQGLAFDLDGFWWADDTRFMMDEYPANPRLYLGINAHLFHYFSQVLSYHYAGHRDHFHVDFNFTDAFRPGSDAQGYFVQAALRHVYGKPVGSGNAAADNFARFNDGIPANVATAIREVLAERGIMNAAGQQATQLSEAGVWRAFLSDVRARAFAP